MNRIIICFSIIAQCLLNAEAQEGIQTVNSDPPVVAAAEADRARQDPDTVYFVAVEQLPEPIGGMASIQSRVVYPEIARRAGIEGMVYVEAFINENGNVAKTKVLGGIGAGCDESAQEAIKNTKFRPGTQHGKPVKVRLAIPVSFKIGDKDQSYKMKTLEGPLTADDFESALRFLDVSLERYMYEIPYRHKLIFTYEQHIKGMREKTFGPMTTILKQGNQTLRLFLRREDDNLVFSVAAGRGSTTSPRIPIKGYAAFTSTAFEPLFLEEKRKTPIFAFAANANSVKAIISTEKLEDVVKNYDMVIAVMVELEHLK